MRDREKGRMTCIMCPRGCSVEYILSGREYTFSGHGCRKGEEYALSELTHPTRTVTTTVATVFPDFPRLPVKTAKQVSLEEIFRYMREINKIVARRRYRSGEILEKNLLGQGVALIATGDMHIFPPIKDVEGE